MLVAVTNSQCTREESMTDLCIQIHPHRCPQLVLADLRSTCERVANNKTLVKRFSWTEGFDGHSYVNLTFATEHAEELWNMLRQQFYESTEFAKFHRDV